VTKEGITLFIGQGGKEGEGGGDCFLSKEKLHAHA
jgi:hypothetical protein